MNKIFNKLRRRSPSVCDIESNKKNINLLAKLK